MTFHSKIFLVILVVHLIIGSVSVFFVNNILNEALSIGLNTNIKADIENIYDASREEVATRKRLYDYICRGLLTEIKNDSDIKDLELIREKVLKNLSTYMDLYAINIEGKDIKFLPEGSERDRTIYLSSHILDGKEFRCRFIVPQIVLNNQRSLLNVISVHENISKIKKDLSTFYLRVYIFLFGISFLTVMVLGYMIIGAFLSPIRELKEGIRRIKNNIFDQPINVVTGDEMGELAKELNRLSNELRLAKERESYLERISSYQEVARRIAHDIKNPLTPIRLAFQEIEARYRGDDEEYRKLLISSKEIVEEEISALKKIIDQFREFAKMPVAEKKRVIADDFILDVIKSKNNFSDQINVVLNLNARGVSVDIDIILMRKVIENLIQNSVEADATEIVITSDHKEDFYILRFEDNGKGIDEKIQDVIFEPYFTTKEYGTGLGLSLSKKVILEHKGNIYIDRGYKNGSAFVIELPISL